MTTTCLRCARPNAAEANFCWFDGIPLPGKDAQASVPQRQFATPLIFPSGAAFHSFEEFAPRLPESLERSGRLAASGAIPVLLPRHGAH